MPVSDAALLLDVVREAGELGLSLSRKKNLQHWTKPDGSHVTEGDLAINALFEQRLPERRGCKRAGREGVCQVGGAACVREQELSLIHI